MAGDPPEAFGVVDLTPKDARERLAEAMGGKLWSAGRPDPPAFDAEPADDTEDGPWND